MGPDGIHTREDLARALTALRNQSGLTVRELARRLDTPVATVGDYVSGRHLPGLTQLPLFKALLRECGVDEGSLGGWVDALTRLRQSSDGRVARGPSPYRGLEPFGVEDASLFFGRDTATDELLVRLGDALSARSSEVVWPLIVVGPSGSGKSSLLRAGLAARVAAGALEHVSVPREATVITPAADAVEQLRALTMSAPGSHRLVVVDQFEEVFATSSEDRERFLATLATVRPPDAVLVAALRADFYAAATGEPTLLPALRHSQVLIGPMTEMEMRDAIIKPAHAAGTEIDAALVELLLADLAPGDQSGFAHGPGALPLLSHALLTTWERARHNRLTVADYTATGGLRDAVAQSAENLYNSLTPAEQDLTRRMFCRLTRVDADGPLTRRRVSPRELAELVAPDGEGSRPTHPRLLDRFVSARLITAGAGTVEISHELLLVAWPRLAEWIARDRAGLRLHRQLTEAANAWSDAEGDDSQLLRGTRLQAISEWASEPDHRAELNSTEWRFLDASVGRAEADAAAARRRARRAQQVAALIGILAISAVVLAVVALNARRSADQARTIALSRQVAAEATFVSKSDPNLAMQLALAAFRISPTSQATSALLDAGAGDFATRILGPNGPTALTLDSSGQVFAVVSSPNNQATIYRAVIPRPRVLARVTIGSGPNNSYTAALSPDGHLLATSAGDRVLLWNLSTVTSPAMIANLGSSQGISALAFASSGRRLAVVTGNGAVAQWLLSPTSRPMPLPVATEPHRTPLTAVAYSPTGKALAVVGANGTVAVWDLTRHQPRLVFAREVAHTTMTTVAYSPNGSALAAGADDLTVWHWRATADGLPVGEPQRLLGFANLVSAIAFSHDGRYLAVGDADNTTRLWETSDWQDIATLPDVSTVDGVGFVARDHALATVDDNGTTRLWDLPAASSHVTVGGAYTIDYTANGRQAAVITDGKAQIWNTGDPWHPYQVSEVVMPPAFGSVASVGALTPDGKLLAVGDQPGNVQEFVINPAGVGHAVGPTLKGVPNTFIEQINFTPNGRLLSIGNDEGALHIYGVSDPARPQRLALINLGSGNAVLGVSYSPDGRLLAIGSQDRQVWLWDISNPQHPRRRAVLTGFGNAVYSTTISPDGRTLAAGSQDGTIRMWDITAPSHPRLLASPLTGPTNSVYQVGISPDGRTLAGATTGGEVWLWNIAESDHPQALATLRAATGALYDLTLSPDDQTLVVGGDSQTLTFWHYRPAAVIHRICLFTGTPITREEWTRYLPGVAYDPPCR